MTFYKIDKEFNNLKDKDNSIFLYYLKLAFVI